MTVRVRVAVDQSEIDQALKLRTGVFVDEQGVPLAEELDGLDESATHLVALDDGEIVGTCRLVVANKTIKLGRMVVSQDRRREGIAAEMLRAADREAAELGAERITLAAQCYVAQLYQQAGYHAHGEPFADAGIEHIRMTKRLS